MAKNGRHRDDLVYISSESLTNPVIPLELNGIVDRASWFAVLEETQVFQSVCNHVNNNFCDKKLIYRWTKEGLCVNIGFLKQKREENDANFGGRRNSSVGGAERSDPRTAKANNVKAVIPLQTQAIIEGDEEEDEAFDERLTRPASST